MLNENGMRPQVLMKSKQTVHNSPPRPFGTNLEHLVSELNAPWHANARNEVDAALLRFKSIKYRIDKTKTCANGHEQEFDAPWAGVGMRLLLASIKTHLQVWLVNSNSAIRAGSNSAIDSTPVRAPRSAHAVYPFSPLTSSASSAASRHAVTPFCSSSTKIQ